MNVQNDTSPNFMNPLSQTAGVDTTTDYTGHIKLEDLSPDTESYYSVSFSSLLQLSNTTNTTKSTTSNSVNGTFQTAPNPSKEKPVSFAVGGDLAGQTIIFDGKNSLLNNWFTKHWEDRWRFVYLNCVQ